MQPKYKLTEHEQEIMINNGLTTNDVVERLNEGWGLNEAIMLDKSFRQENGTIFRDITVNGEKQRLTAQEYFTMSAKGLTIFQLLHRLSQGMKKEIAIEIKPNMSEYDRDFESIAAPTKPNGRINYTELLFQEMMKQFLERPSV